MLCPKWPGKVDYHMTHDTNNTKRFEIPCEVGTAEWPFRATRPYLLRFRRFDLGPELFHQFQLLLQRTFERLRGDFLVGERSLHAVPFLVELARVDRHFLGDTFLAQPGLDRDTRAGARHEIRDRHLGRVPLPVDRHNGLLLGRTRNNAGVDTHGGGSGKHVVCSVVVRTSCAYWYDMGSTQWFPELYDISKQVCRMAGMVHAACVG